MLTLVDKENGEVRSQVVPDVTGATLRAAIADNVDASVTTFHTDLAHAYWKVGPDFAVHETVDHGAGEYVRGDVSTNQAENFFSQLKRSIDGTHHHVNKEHLPRYLAEFDYRHSTRKMSDAQRMSNLMGRVYGRRLL